MLPSATESSESRSNDGYLTREFVGSLVLLFATALACYLCFLIVQPFLPAITWALALAVIGRPFHRWLAARVRYRWLSAGIVVLSVTLLVAAPVAFITYELLNEATSYVKLVERDPSKAIPGNLNQLAERHPRLEPAIKWIQQNIDVAGETQRLLATSSQRLANFLSGSAWFTVQFLIMLLTLFYFFKDEERSRGAVRNLLPLTASESTELLKQVDDAIHATIFGTLVVALLQGVLGGLMFWWLGLPGALFWGFIMALLAIVPYLGAFVVWAPAAAFLALQGSWGSAVILTLWGTVVVGLIDNLVYPLIVGKRLRQHTMVEFFAIVGGLAVFGAAGIVLGPVLATVTFALIQIWRRRTAGGEPAESNAPSSG